MNNTTDFSKLLASFLTEYLPAMCNVSKNTITSYCDTFRLLLTYCRDTRNMKIERLWLKDFSPELIKDFLVWIRDERHCSVSTRNQRLAAIHSFFKYAQAESPNTLLISQKILNIPFSKKEKAAIQYLTVDEMTDILSRPNVNNAKGRRDLCFLSLLYDTGGRVSEITALKVRDVRLEHPAKVVLFGKGRKLREVPLLKNTVTHLESYLSEQRLTSPDKLDHPLFFNRQRNHLTRAGAAYILNKYVSESDISRRVSPHILRHTKAMHLLDAGVNIFYIKGLLGHEDISTTEIYAKANIETQRTALENYSSVLPEATPFWANDSDTLEWLKSFGKS